MDDRYLELLFKEADFSITDPEKEELYAWINASEGNRMAAKKMREAWDLSAVAGPDIVIDLEGEYEQVRTKISTGRNKRLVARVWKIAASVLVLAGFFWFSTRQNSKAKIDVQMVSGPLDTHLLEDGSTIWLMDGSELTFQMTTSTREADLLSGRGYFEIAEDENRPFEIETDLGKVVVLGTAFEIEIKEDQSLAVRVAQGKVLMSSPDDSMHLFKGDVGLIVGGKLQKGALTQPVGAWRLDPIVYSQEELGTILQQLEKNYLVEFEVNNPEILDCKLSFTMAYQELSELIAMLETLLDAKITMTGTAQYSLNSQGCK